ncbi:hypothetical protein FHR61_003303 [Xanthomonas arboricola]|uniref:Uncharacterized protein n=1 Tax=Xanthomonas cannabis TaxID=1885674 RepID=A0ABR6JP78_9XANT|nr:hypothetical protein [Xanthomonas cannabis]MBB4594639.1 hypothetical protein [Xanthomonas cannabis]MBB5523428.1 hypothetical protein [Xanthomonas cannabis]
MDRLDRVLVAQFVEGVGFPGSQAGITTDLYQQGTELDPVGGFGRRFKDRADFCSVLRPWSAARARIARCTSSGILRTVKEGIWPSR